MRTGGRRHGPARRRPRGRPGPPAPGPARTRRTRTTGRCGWPCRRGRRCEPGRPPVRGPAPGPAWPAPRRAARCRRRRASRRPRWPGPGPARSGPGATTAASRGRRRGGRASRPHPRHAPASRCARARRSSVSGVAGTEPETRAEVSVATTAAGSPSKPSTTPTPGSRTSTLGDGRRRQSGPTSSWAPAPTTPPGSNTVLTAGCASPRAAASSRRTPASCSAISSADSNRSIGSVAVALSRSGTATRGGGTAVPRRARAGDGSRCSESRGGEEQNGQHAADGVQVGRHRRTGLRHLGGLVLEGAVDRGLFVVDVADAAQVDDLEGVARQHDVVGLHVAVQEAWAWKYPMAGRTPSVYAIALSTGIGSLRPPLASRRSARIALRLLPPM